MTILVIIAVLLFSAGVTGLIYIFNKPRTVTVSEEELIRELAHTKTEASMKTPVSSTPLKKGQLVAIGEDAPQHIFIKRLKNGKCLIRNIHTMKLSKTDISSLNY